MIRKLFLVPLMALMLCVVAGCKNPYDSAVKGSNDVATVISNAYPTLEGLRQSGTITPKEELTIASWLDAANTLNGGFEKCAASVHAANGNVAAYLGCVTTFSNSINNPQMLVEVRVLSPVAQQYANVIISGVKTTISSIEVKMLGSNAPAVATPTPATPAAPKTGSAQ